MPFDTTDTMRFHAELRAEPKERRLVGRAIAYNERSLDLGGFREVIKPGACTKALAENDVLALADHDLSMIVGRKSKGTLVAEERADGVHVTITPPDTTYGRDLVEAVRRGDKNGMSFNCSVPLGGDVWKTEDNGRTVIREVLIVDLREVTVTGLPAYPTTHVELRNAAGARNTALAAALVKIERNLPLDDADIQVIEHAYALLHSHAPTHAQWVRRMERAIAGLR